MPRPINDYRLYRDYPFLKNYDPANVERKTGLSAFHQDYVNSVSVEAAAISLELAYFIYYMCDELAPKSILDMGSGFSSYVTRLYRKNANPDCITVSVDSEEIWLEKTEAYLRSHGMAPDRMATWDEFNEKDMESRYDLVLHDLGSPGRVESLGRVLESVHERGTLIIDDMHKPNYRTPIKKILSEHGNVKYDLSRLTLDRFDRYAWLASRNHG